MIDKEYIEAELEKRKITRLCHFTKFSKLLHMMELKEITATDFIDDDILDVNDKERKDGHKDYICCTVQYPNTWYLSKAKERDSVFVDWVILFIDPRYMMRSTTLFSCRNAASGNGQFLERGYRGFMKMFAQSVQGKSTFVRNKGMIPACPTDGQAEVLIYKSISLAHVLAIGGCSSENIKHYLAAISRLNSGFKIPWIVCPDLFSNKWHEMTRKGKRPEEIIYTGVKSK